MLEIALVVSESTTLAAALVAAFVAAVVAASVKDDRSTLLARLLSPLITLEDVDVENVIFYRGISDSNELYVSTYFNSYCLKPNTIYECDGIYYGIFENKESALNLIRQYRKTKNELKIKELQRQIDELHQENNNI
jgi:hypothetical protein